jgi:hypothetical protein
MLRAGSMHRRTKILLNIADLKRELKKHPAANVRFVLPTAEPIPAHAHVTEVARIDKRFIDCGGTLRNDSVCRLQTWSSDDVDHRLTAEKLAKILDKAAPLLQSEELDVDVEYEIGFVSQFPIASVEASSTEITLRLKERHTACLALDQCKPPKASLSPLNPLQFNFRESPHASGCCK